MAPKRWQNIALFCPQPIAEMEVGQKWAKLRQIDQLCPTMRKACHLVNMHSETPSVECNFELLCSASVYAMRAPCLVSDRARQLERLQLATSGCCLWVALTSTLTHTFHQFQINKFVKNRESQRFTTSPTVQFYVTLSYNDCFCTKIIETMTILQMI